MARPNLLPIVRQKITEAGVGGITFSALREQVGCSESCLRKHVARLRKEGWLAEDRVEKQAVGRPGLILIDRRFR